ncbi:hypothetical protein JHK87_024115 [Glycine soja]|nr:hypothetical protein JHK87_024115 [Glycine soja]
METRKERMEQVKKEEIKGSRNTSKEENATKGDTVSKRVIRESLVSGGDKERAQKPDDGLVLIGIHSCYCQS